jgi:hypothetical protein
MYRTPNETGTPTRVTGSGVNVITSGHAALLGFFTSSGAPGTIQLFHGTATGNAITGVITAVTGGFYRCPAYCSGGLSALVTGWTSPDLTFFWNPAD